VIDRLVPAVEAGGARAMVVGSASRGTWVRGDRDLDLFLLFPPELDRDSLERDGLALARSIALEFGDGYREKYAEHPYINATVDGIDVDLVPCYCVASATGIQSAVDRTPFHTRYVAERIAGLVDDVLLLKQFAKAGGVYGSDQMTEGFAGYLCELLVLRYGSFEGVLAAASGWRPGTVIDLEGHAAKTFDEPLVVVDPVDPNRNVSASVSLSRMMAFVELARGYLAAPSIAFFTVRPDPPIPADAFAARLDARGTSLYGIRFPTPNLIEDVVVPQLRKSLEGLVALLERHGFSVNRADSAMGPDHCLLVLELLVDTLPAVARHQGPPLWNGENAAKFREKYAAAPGPGPFAGPFIEDGRYVVELPRRHRTAGSLLGSDEVLGVSLGKHVRRALARRELLAGAGCWSEEFATFLGAFLDPASPQVRLERG
jgi:tRNA nucleotidyltransferase (CCA-adding enzyme)